MLELKEAYEKCGINTPALHQKEAWDYLSSGQPIIVRAPTGSGKTEASVLPFLALNSNNIPTRMIYALPMRVLANQIAHRIRAHSQKLNKPSEFRVALQHGESPESALFYADVVVATIDQVIIAYACASNPRYGNIPAGAIMSSFVVFDEIHLLDPKLAFQGARIICERLNNFGLPYAVFSATLPDIVLDYWAQQLGAKIIEIQEEFVKRQVKVTWTDKHISFEEVKKFLNCYNKILVVCNTVDRALNLYKEIKEYAISSGYTCQLIHSRFLADDRKRKEKEIEAQFGKVSAREAKSLVISTQVIEAGLDISADLLLTEVAPIDALIQRAGRVARWGGEGDVYVYDVDRYNPYSKDFVLKTKEIIKNNSGCVLDWEKSKLWVNKVFNDFYNEIIHENSYYYRIMSQLSSASFDGNKRQAEAAVRHINNVSVSIHNNPEMLGVRALSLDKVDVHIGKVKKWLKTAMQENKLAWLLEIVDYKGSDTEIVVKIKPIEDPEQITVGKHIIFPSSFLNYCPDLGLHQGQGEYEFGLVSKDVFQPYDINFYQESWIEHAIKAASHIEEIMENEYKGVEGIMRIFNIPAYFVKMAVKMAALLHDLGKLNKDWQNRAGVETINSPSQFLAHTAKRDYSPFPPHATVGAYALWPALMGSQVIPKNLAKAVALAIAHHHSVRAKDVIAYELHPKWREAVGELIHLYGMERFIDLNLVISSQPHSTFLREKFPLFENSELYNSYILISRWLRLADRKATGGEYAILRHENRA